MNRNDIRPAAIGIAAGVSVFAGLIAWVEVDPWSSVAERVARHRLSPAERAEIERIEAERDERNREYSAAKQDRETQRLQVLAGFSPQLLKTPGSVTSPQELSVDDLVAEIEHAEQSRYQYPVSGDGSWFRHCEALEQEFRERRNNWKLPRVEQLRLDIAAERVRAARTRPVVIQTPPPVASDLGEFPPFSGEYPDFTGPDPKDSVYGCDTEIGGER